LVAVFFLGAAFFVTGFLAVAAFLVAVFLGATFLVGADLVFFVVALALAFFGAVFFLVAGLAVTGFFLVAGFFLAAVLAVAESLYEACSRSCQPEQNPTFRMGRAQVTRPRGNRGKSKT
jgi:hypothetical protein